MSDYSDIFKQLKRRGIIGFPALIGGIAVLFSLLNISSPALAGVVGFMGCILIFMGAGLLAYPIARLIAEPSRNLFYPSDHPDRPPPNYGILEAKRKRGEYEEAMAGLEQIMKEFPGEVKPYIEMIDITIRDLNDPKRAKRIFSLGLSAMEKDEDKETLERIYSMISGELNMKMRGH